MVMYILSEVNGKLQWTDKNGTIVDKLPSRLHELRNGAPAIHTGLSTKEKEFYSKAIGEEVNNYRDIESKGYTLDKINHTVTPSTSKSTIIDEFKKNKEKAESLVKLSPEIAEKLKQGFKMSENEDGSVDLLSPDNEINDDDDDDDDDDERPILDGEPVVNMASLINSAKAKAEEKAALRRTHGRG